MCRIYATYGSNGAGRVLVAFVIKYDNEEAAHILDADNKPLELIAHAQDA